MKKIFKYILPCVVMAWGLCSCSDDDEYSKAAFDAAYETEASASTVTLTNTIAASYNKVKTNIVLSDASAVVEQGLEVSENEDFSDSKLYPAESTDPNYEFELPAVPNTTYYVRAYAYLKSGATIVSEPAVVTTPDFTYSLEGTYTLTDYWCYWDEEFETGYEITVAFADGSDTTVEITNILNGGKTIVGEYDSETGMIIVPNGQVLLDDLAGYGEAVMDGLDDTFEDADFTYFIFDEKTGALESGAWYLNVSLGTWNVLSIIATHN